MVALGEDGRDVLLQQNAGQLIQKHKVVKLVLNIEIGQAQQGHLIMAMHVQLQNHRIVLLHV
jgi:hypothetical protein